jgi:uncharacterized protein with HEPN domain
MSKRADSALLNDIQEAIRRVQAYTEDLTYAEFLKTTQIQDAVVRNLEIFGEAVKRLSSEVKQRYEYFGVNWDIVWAVIRDELPALRRQLRRRH